MGTGGSTGPRADYGLNDDGAVFKRPFFIGGGVRTFGFPKFLKNLGDVIENLLDRGDEMGTSYARSEQKSKGGGWQWSPIPAEKELVCILDVRGLSIFGFRSGNHSQLLTLLEEV